jgi:peroxiredoxin
MTRTTWTWRLALAAAMLALALPAVAGKSEKSAGAARGAGAAVKALAIGSKAPMADVKMKSVDGSEFSIADVKGEKGTLVIFSCNACPWVKAWESRIAEIGNAYSQKGVGVIVINSNDPAVQAEDGYDVMQQRAEKYALGFPYVVDASSGVARAFGATRTPEVFLFDAKGKLVYHGAVDDNAHEPGKVQNRYLAAALDAVIAGKPVVTAETKALGCSIKFRKAGTGA